MLAVKTIINNILNIINELLLKTFQYNQSQFIEHDYWKMTPILIANFWVFHIATFVMRFDIIMAGLMDPLAFCNDFAKNLHKDVQSNHY